jgi:hypothetical protein
MIEGEPKWSEMSEEHVFEYRQAAALGTAAPGSALIVVGCLGICANLVLVMVLHAIRERTPVQPPAGTDRDAALCSGRRTGPAQSPALPFCAANQREQEAGVVGKYVFSSHSDGNLSRWGDWLARPQLDPVPQGLCWPRAQRPLLAGRRE